MNYLVNAYGYLGVFIVELVSTSSIFIPIPGYVATIAAGTVLNPFAVGVSAGFGAATGELTTYCLPFGDQWKKDS
jgi:membrane protein DedA with SNARE-associated domain